MTTRIQLVRAEHIDITKQERATAWRVLGRMVTGLTPEDQQAWNGLWNVLANLEAGEMSEISVHVDRFPPSHRRHMALESAIWHAQECFEDFDPGFRDWLKVGAGFVEWEVSAGLLVAKPRSTSYVDCDELTMRKFTARVLRFMRTERAAGKLWPHMTPRGRDEMVNSILKPFEKETPR